MEVYSIAEVNPEQLCTLIQCLQNWVSLQYPAINPSEISQILSKTLQHERSWQEGLYCVTIQPMGEWLFKLRMRKQKIPVVARFWHLFYQFSFIRAIQFKQALIPLWWPIPKHHCLLEYICGSSDSKKEDYFAIMQIALNHAKSLQFSYIDCLISSQDLYFASICRKLGFVVHPNRLGQWCLMTKALKS